MIYEEVKQQIWPQDTWVITPTDSGREENRPNQIGNQDQNTACKWRRGSMLLRPLPKSEQQWDGEKKLREAAMGPVTQRRQKLSVPEQAELRRSLVILTGIPRVTAA